MTVNSFFSSARFLLLHLFSAPSLTLVPFVLLFRINSESISHAYHFLVLSLCQISRPSCHSFGYWLCSLSANPISTTLEPSCCALTLSVLFGTSFVTLACTQKSTPKRLQGSAFRIHGRPRRWLSSDFRTAFLQLSKFPVLEKALTASYFVQHDDCGLYGYMNTYPKCLDCCGSAIKSAMQTIDDTVTSPPLNPWTLRFSSPELANRLPERHLLLIFCRQPIPS